MAMKRILPLGILAMCTACGGNSEDGGSCGPGAACGGDLVGSWAVQNVCVVGDSFAEAVTGSLPEQCADAVEQTTLVPMDVVIEYTASGTSRTSGSLRVDVQARLSQACLNAAARMTFPISNTTCRLAGATAQAQTEEEYPGATYSCTDAGDSCLCDVSVPTPLEGSGTYAVQGDQIISDGQGIDYCISGNTLSIEQPEGRFEARRLR
jgi:hypothetical protein